MQESLVYCFLFILKMQESVTAATFIAIEVNVGVSQAPKMQESACYCLYSNTFGCLAIFSITMQNEWAESN